jgi:hypothetical protein
MLNEPRLLGPPVPSPFGLPPQQFAPEWPKRQHFCRNCVALIILNRQEDGLQEIVEGGT